MKNNRTLLQSLTVPQIIVLGFLSVILVITLLLLLPVSAADGQTTTFVDALFTAVSSVCVTGLVVVNTAQHWSLFGQIVIVVAAQIGALGFMTFITLFSLFLGKKITLKERMLIQHSLNQSDLKGMVRLVKSVVIGTLFMEVLAALVLSVDFMLTEKVSYSRGLWYGVFHSICAFCSAGFDILQDTSMSRYVGDPVMNIVLMLLVFMGSLGYTVWIDILSVLRTVKDKRQVYKRLSLQSRIVLELTLALTLFGAAFFFVCEFSNPDTFGELTLPAKIYASFFQSVTPRTLGYSTVHQDNLRYSAKLMTLIFMFIGGSPGSTCGGIKTVTFAVIVAAIHSVVKGRDTIVLRMKTIAFETLQKSLAIVGVYLFVVLGMTMALTFTEAGNPYPYELMDLLFEAFSATGTVGLSMGITPHLTVGGKLIIVLCMFLGRIGGVTVAISLSAPKKAENSIHYPEAKLMVG